MMLVLSRHVNEVVMIGDSIKVIVLNVHGNSVEIGFVAPQFIPVHRAEVYRRIHLENKAQNKIAYYNVKQRTPVEVEWK